MKYLITWYTKTGTTKEIADQLAQALRDRGTEVDILPLEQAADLTPYSHVIVGAPINGMQWVPQAKQYLQANAAALDGVVLSLFAVSYVMHSGWKLWRKIVAKGIAELARTSGARQTAIFRGRIDKPLPTPARMLFGIPAATPLDLQDPTEVQAWAQEL
ncbi:flavodoxin [Spirochaeta africana]|uniref:Flavodoxin n=1 Tax=Spirochaeta africana (strain ATCC 700263 / DSM 8902 / Z-7692) TaxID=889378 RepID=H9UHW6_SPIAZ|nr:flavodoxin [Spirochaeta africana]AFG37109.1 flavodoxin [Spirochaeta africana DSM 8902]